MKSTNFLMTALFLLMIAGQAKTAYSQPLSADTVCLSNTDYTFLINGLVKGAQCDSLYAIEQAKVELFKEANKELKTALLDLQQVNELYESEKQTFTGRLEEKDKEIKSQKVRRIASIITTVIVSWSIARAIK